MITKSILAVAILFTLSFPLGETGAQDQTSDAKPGALALGRTYGQAVELNGQGLTARSSSSPFARLNVNSKQRKFDEQTMALAKQLRQSKSSQQRLEAKDKLAAHLSEDYDSRLEGYEKYLLQLEEKLAEMRRKLEKRREAKAEMIQLRIKVLEAEAEDLGWPERVAPRQFFDSSRFPARIRGFGATSPLAPKSSSAKKSGQNSR